MQRNVVFVNCWHISPGESAAMWALYSTDSDGVAIQSTFGEAAQAFGPGIGAGSLGSTVGAGEVEYVDPDVEEKPGLTANMILAALTKRHWYAYEKELRFMYVDMANYVRPLPEAECTPGTAAKPGLWLRCNLQRLIKSIVLVPSAPAFIQDSVAVACGHFGIDPAIIRQSKLREGAPGPPDESEWRTYLQELREKHGRPFGITL